MESRRGRGRAALVVVRTSDVRPEEEVGIEQQIRAEQGQPGSLRSWFQVFNSNI